MTAEIHTDMPFDEYRAHPALSQSTLKLMGVSPTHCRAALDGLLPDKDTGARRNGRGEHVVILEGLEAFKERVLVAPSSCEATKKGDGLQCTNAPSYYDRHNDSWYCGTHRHTACEQPSDYCTQGEFVKYQAMAASVRDHEINRHLARPGGGSEVTIIYEKDVTANVTSLCVSCGSQTDKLGFEDYRCHACGHRDSVVNCKTIVATLQLKARIDRLLQPYKRFGHLVVDLKRHGRKWSEDDFRWAIANHEYHVQMAQYREAVSVAYDVPLESIDGLWLAVEPEPPYDVLWRLANDDDKRIGAELLEQYRRQYVVCEHTGHWPGVCEGPNHVGGLPERYVQNFDKGNEA